MEAIQLSKNTVFFGFLVVGYLFGVFLYDLLELKFIDELMVAFLVMLLALLYRERKRYLLLSHLAILFVYFAFQIGYSLLIGSNLPQAILTDAVIQIKPFLGFYTTYILMAELSRSHKKILTLLMLAGGGTLLILALIDYHWEFFGHISRFATAATITAVVYLYCSSFRWADVGVFLLLLAVGFFSTRTKFYGFYVLAAGLVVAVKLGYRFQFSLLSAIGLIAIAALVVAVSWHRIELYFIEGMFRSKEMWARPVLYLTAGAILITYIPFGSGLASFATFASASYYSPTYTEFKIDQIFGLSHANPDFITDTYYPALAEFGLVGVALFLFFWGYWITQAKRFYLAHRKGREKEFLLFILIVLFFAIESTTDSTLTHNRGLFMMILLGLTLSDLHRTAQPIPEKP